MSLKFYYTLFSHLGCNSMYWIVCSLKFPEHYEDLISFLKIRYLDKYVSCHWILNYSFYESVKGTSLLDILMTLNIQLAYFSYYQLIDVQIIQILVNQDSKAQSQMNPRALSLYKMKEMWYWHLLGSFTPLSLCRV